MGRGQGGLARASPQRAVSAKPTQPPACYPATRRAEASCRFLWLARSRETAAGIAQRSRLQKSATALQRPTWDLFSTSLKTESLTRRLCQRLLPAPVYSNSPNRLVAPSLSSLLEATSSTKASHASASSDSWGSNPFSLRKTRHVASATRLFPSMKG